MQPSTSSWYCHCLYFPSGKGEERSKEGRQNCPRWKRRRKGTPAELKKISFWMAVAWNPERGTCPGWYHPAEPWTATLMEVQESKGRTEVQLLWLLGQQQPWLESLLTSSKPFFLVKCPSLPFSQLLTTYANCSTKSWTIE